MVLVRALMINNNTLSNPGPKSQPHSTESVQVESVQVEDALGPLAHPPSIEIAEIQLRQLNLSVSGELSSNESSAIVAALNDARENGRLGPKTLVTLTAAAVVGRLGGALTEVIFPILLQEAPVLGAFAIQARLSAPAGRATAEFHEAFKCCSLLPATVARLCITMAEDRGFGLHFDDLDKEFVEAPPIEKFPSPFWSHLLRGLRHDDEMLSEVCSTCRNVELPGIKAVSFPGDEGVRAVELGVLVGEALSEDSASDNSPLTAAHVLLETTDPLLESAAFLMLGVSDDLKVQQIADQVLKKKYPVLAALL